MAKGTKLLLIALAAVLLLGAFLITVGTVTARESTIVAIELAAGRVITFCGLVITTASALVLIGQAITSKSLEATLPLTIPAVIGLFLVSPHWSIGLFLCVVAIGCLALQLVKLIATSRGSGSSSGIKPEPASPPEPPQDRR